MTVPPDWITSTPSTPAVHNKPPPAGGELTLPFTPQQLVQIGAQFIEQFLAKVVQAVIGVFIPGDNGAAFTQLQGWASGIESLLIGVPAEIEAAIQGLITGLIQQVIDAIVGGFTGGSTTGNDPLALLFAVIGEATSLPVQVMSAIDQLWASFAQVLSGQQALQNSPGTALIDDFATIGVSGYSPIVGTLAVSSAGPYLQTPNLAVAYRTVGPSTNQHGSQIVIDGIQEGWCGTAICSDTAATSYALLQVYSGFEGDAVRLLTGSSPTVAVVQQQADFIATRLANTNTYDAWYEIATNTVHVLRNGQKVFDWPDLGTSSTDPANLLTHDASHRKVLLMTNGEDNPENGSRGPGIGKHTEYDKK